MNYKQNNKIFILIPINPQNKIKINNKNILNKFADQINLWLIIHIKILNQFNKINPRDLPTQIKTYNKYKYKNPINTRILLTPDQIPKVQRKYHLNMTKYKIKTLT